MYNYDRYRQSWAPVVERLSYSLNAEQMVCSMTTQLFHFPGTQNLKGNAELHHHLVPASYHRITALGCAKRVHRGETHQSIIKALIDCVNNGLKEDKEVNRWLQVMKKNAPAGLENFMNSISTWQEQAEHSLAYTRELLQEMGYEIGVDDGNRHINRNLLAKLVGYFF
ncbi:hypothetical protein [Sutcliffiella cohnii]|nr:hypothetical protein [Sutcliffiella cohnii]